MIPKQVSGGQDRTSRDDRLLPNARYAGTAIKEGGGKSGFAVPTHNSCGSS